MYDYLLGGKDNFAADREGAEAAIRQFPGLGTTARENRGFMARAVRYAAEQGVRQFLDIGTGIPTSPNTYEVAQKVAPECRVMCVDNDPLVLAHARALIAGDPRGKTSFIKADLRDPESILGDPTLSATLDLNEPVALMLVAVLHFFEDRHEPEQIVRTLVDALVPGSYLIASHLTQDFNANTEGVAASYRARGIPFQVRSEDDFHRIAFPESLKLVDPGISPVAEWRRSTTTPPPIRSECSGYSGVAVKLAQQ